MADLYLLFFCVSIFSNVLALPIYPCAQGVVQKKEHCIEMTPAKEAEIQVMVTKIAKFIDHLATEHESFDISTMKLYVESHSNDEKEDKEVNIHVTVNDCNDKQQKPAIQPTVNYQNKYTTRNLPTDFKESAFDQTNTSADYNALADQTKTANDFKESKTELAIPENRGNEVKPTFYKLDLPQNADELLKVLGKSKQTPILVYVQEREAVIEYIFP